MKTDRLLSTFARRVFPFATWVVMTLAAPVLAQPAEGNLAEEWLFVQRSMDRDLKKDWWHELGTDELKAYLSAGVDVNTSNDRGWTPLHSAARYSSDPGVVAALIEAGATVDARDRARDTPLHWAAAENADASVVTLLIDAGADVNAKDKFGWLPIHTAAESNSNPQVIETLLASGAKRKGRAYFLLFRPSFLLKHNANMSDKDKEAAMTLLKGSQ